MGKDVIPHGIADFYYIPKYLIKRFCKIAEEFYSTKTFLEIAVCNIFGILLEKSYQYVYFKGLWGNDRSKIISYLNNAHMQIVIHPIKFTNEDNKKALIKYIDLMNDV